jgi:translation initiation factor IF-1
MMKMDECCICNKKGMHKMKICEQDAVICERHFDFYRSLKKQAD